MRRQTHLRAPRSARRSNQSASWPRSLRCRRRCPSAPGHCWSAWLSTFARMSSGVARTVARAVAHRTARRSMPRATRTRPQPYRPGKRVARLGDLRSGGRRVVQPATRSLLPDTVPATKHSIREKQIPPQRLGPTTNPDTHGQHRTQDQPRAEHTLVSALRADTRWVIGTAGLSWSPVFMSVCRHDR
jgi:hypothetical protein